MTEHDDLLYLAHIDEAARRIEHTVSVQGRAALSGDFKAAHAEIPWNRVGGFRNRVVHGYLDVNLDIVWAIVRHDLPQLVNCVRAELALRIERSHEPDTGFDIGF